MKNSHTQQDKSGNRYCFYPAWLYGPARRFSEILLDFLKFIIIAVVGLAPAIGCYTSPARGVRRNADIEHRASTFRWSREKRTPCIVAD